jgi:hypothetical protein
MNLMIEEIFKWCERGGDKELGGPGEPLDPQHKELDTLLHWPLNLCDRIV